MPTHVGRSSHGGTTFRVVRSNGRQRPMPTRIARPMERRNHCGAIRLGGLGFAGGLNKTALRVEPLNAVFSDYSDLYRSANI